MRKWVGQTDTHFNLQKELAQSANSLKVQSATWMLVLLAHIPLLVEPTVQSGCLSQIPFFPEYKLQPGFLSSCLRFPSFQSLSYSQYSCHLVSDSLLFRVQITARILVLLSQIPFFPESKLQPGCLSSCLRFPSFQSPNYSQDSCPPVLDSLLSRVQVTPRILVLLSEIPFFPQSKLQPVLLSSCLRFPSFQSPSYSQDACPLVSDSLLSRVQETARILGLLSQIPFFPESKLQPGCLSSCLRFPSFQSPKGMDIYDFVEIVILRQDH